MSNAEANIRTLQWLSVLRVNNHIDDTALFREIDRAFTEITPSKERHMMISCARVRYRFSSDESYLVYLRCVATKQRNEKIDKCLMSLKNGVTLLKWNFTCDLQDDEHGLIRFDDRPHHRIVDTESGRRFGRSCDVLDVHLSTYIRIHDLMYNKSGACSASVANAASLVDCNREVAMECGSGGNICRCCYLLLSPTHLCSRRWRWWARAD